MPVVNGRAASALTLVVSIAIAAVACSRQDAGPIELANPDPDVARYFGLTPQFAVSPDGQRFVFVASPSGQGPLLWIRSSTALDPRPLPGTEFASYPFWSPDGTSVGFFAAGKLKTVPIAGGPPVIVCDAPTGRGGSWNATGVIVFTSGIQDPLRRVAADGGTPEVVTTVDVPRENSHRWPQFLPDGRHILYWAGAGTSPPQLKIGSLDSRESVAFGPADANGAYAAGYVFFKTGDSLMAQPFDAGSLQRTGEPVEVVQPISGDAGSAFASFSAAASGTLLYTRGRALPLVLTWFDRSGRTLGTVGPPGQYTNATLSPDETTVAVSLTAGTPPNRDVWTIDLKTGAATRLTTAAAVDATPVWSPDGQDVIYSSQRDGPYQMYRQRRAASAPAERLLESARASIATDWSADGSTVAFTRTGAPMAPGLATGLDLWTLRLQGGASSRLLETTAAEDNGAFSPDGQWFAYQSNASGRDEVYLHHAPAGRVRLLEPRQVSNAGGTQPRWRGDSQELFFLASDGALMAAAIRPGAAVEPAVRLLPSMTTLVIRHSYTVTKDGQRILAPVIDHSSPPVITAVANWPATVK